MLKRNIAVVIVVGVALAGAAVAWAGGSPARPTVLAAAQTDPSTPAPPSTEAPADLKARREALRACVERAGEDREARRACQRAAGPGVRQRHGRGPRRGGPAHLLGRAVHGTVVVPDGNGGWQTVTFDRGRVDQATDGSRIVLDRPDGQTVTLALTPETRYHGIENAGQVAEDRPAVVVSRDGKALDVLQKDPSRKRGNKNEAPVVPHD